MVVEQTKLQMALAPDDVTDLFSQLEADRLKETEPQAMGVQNKLFVLDDRRFTAVQLSRKGLRGTDVFASTRFRSASISIGWSAGRPRISSRNSKQSLRTRPRRSARKAAAAAAAAPAPNAKP